MDFLTSMANASRARYERARSVRDDAEIVRAAESCAPASPLILSHDGFDLLAEVKRTSPAAGQLADEDLAPAEQGRRYADAGAAAVSVLTEPSRFGGDLSHLKAVSAAVAPTPAMRKDFLVAPYQVIEARAAGASGVLLIAAMLDVPGLRDMLQTALDLRMFVLVEAFDEADVERCAPVMDDAGTAFDAERCRMLIGVNCRDLRTLEVDFPRFERLADRLPPGLPWVAESGVTSPDQAAVVAAMGYDLALVGTALMRAEDPGKLAAALLDAGRAAAPSG
ncbi:MAG: indole-3-glycerol-phosphate synthase [Gammaproteobacteria bacterium]